MHKNTPKQREIMGLVCKAVQNGQELNARTLHAQLSYGATASKQAVQCSIDFLETHGLLVKELRGRQNYLTPTERGLALYGSKPVPEDFPTI